MKISNGRADFMPDIKQNLPKEPTRQADHQGRRRSGRLNVDNI